MSFRIRCGSSSTTGAFLRANLDDSIELVNCSDGFSALGKALHDRFDVVVCGGQLNGLDGLAFLTASQLNPATTKYQNSVVIQS